MTTTNLADFGYRERVLLVELLDTWNRQGLPDDFYDGEVIPMFNTHSGNVFLTNSECQVAMVNDGKLESFYHTPYNGYEGFLEDLQELFEQDGDSWHNDDIEFLHVIGGISDDEYNIIINAE